MLTIKNFLAAAALTAVAVALPLSSAQAQVTQQSKMKTCNVDAKGKKGAERKAFMKSCLSSDKAGGLQATKKPKAKASNATAAKPMASTGAPR